MASIPSDIRTTAAEDGGLNLLAPEAWKALLSRYSHIVLVANSEAVDLERLRSELPETALYVFF
ncbi:3-deoxy-manno-octulosonate cytidylyltransferase, partial [Rhizobium binae]|nr:3-deoxy-manno-octulosonate cytidylyltransferase [Rhizobium binae]